MNVRFTGAGLQVEVQHFAEKMLHFYLEPGELTAEHVRTARTNYGPFDIVLMTNPNGTPTQDSLDTAKTIQVAILPWRQFLERLGSR